MLGNFAPPLALIFSAFEWESLALPALWLVVILAAIAVESATADLVAIWFAPGAFVSMILAFLEVSFTVQLVVFVSVTVLGLVLTFAVFKRLLKKSHRVEKTNADALVGSLALVEEDIDNIAATGVVKINGQLWTARMTDPADTPKKGEWVEIVQVAGAKLICKPKV